MEELTSLWEGYIFGKLVDILVVDILVYIVLGYISEPPSAKKVLCCTAVLLYVAFCFSVIFDFPQHTERINTVWNDPSASSQKTSGRLVKVTTLVEVTESRMVTTVTTITDLD